MAAGLSYLGWFMAQRADFEQFDFEDERRAAWDGRTALISIGDIRRANQRSLSADPHLLDTFRPALDHLIEREFGRLVAFVRTVELGPVG